MLPYKNLHAFEDFYDGIRSIKDNVEESFGKKVGPQNVYPNFNKHMKKIVSVENFHGMQGYENGMKKSYSTNAFDENDVEQYHYGKQLMGYVYEEQSTMASLSPYNSMGSLSSMVSMNTAGAHVCKKNKFSNGKKKQQQQLIHLNSVGEPDFRSKYKTEVCKYWAEYGFCEFGDSCAFAHGKDEIRQKVHVSYNYKTKKCVQFHETGLCLYGLRCQFIHCLRKDQPGSSVSCDSYAQEIEHADIWYTEDADCLCMKRKNRPRLSCFKKLAEKQDDKAN